MSDPQPGVWPDFIAPPKYDDPDPRWRDPALPDFRLIWRVARECGYAIGLHGSMKRDCDLIAAPWTDEAVVATDLIEMLCEALDAKTVGKIEAKPHGRTAWNLQINGYVKTIDISVMPRPVDIARADTAAAVTAALERAARFCAFAARAAEDTANISREACATELCEAIRDMIPADGPAALDAMIAAAVKRERDRWSKQTRATFEAMVAMRDQINEHVAMPSLESDLLEGPEDSVFCATVAEAVIDCVVWLRTAASALYEELSNATSQHPEAEWHGRAADVLEANAAIREGAPK